jgi:outer membrane protein assembly factor BamB
VTSESGCARLVAARRRLQRPSLSIAMSIAALLLAGCAPSAPAPAPASSPATGSPLVYARAWQPWLGAVAGAGGGRIGRGVAPARLAPLPVTAAQPYAPLRAPKIWQLPAPGVGASPGGALAAVAGSDSLGQAVELIDVDAGVVRWRTREPSGPIVGVTATAIVGADRGTWALDLDGASLWHTGSVFAAMAGELVAVAGAMDQVSVLEASTGRELWRTTLPAPLVASDVRWACAGAEAAGSAEATAAAEGGAGELLLIDDRGTLLRVVASERGARIAWSVAESLVSVEGCDGVVVAATQPDARGVYQLLRLDRRDGEVKARVAGVRGHWLERDGALVVAGEAGVVRYDARGGRLISPATLGGRLAERGGRTLVRAGRGVAILEPDGRVQRLAALADSAALGDGSLLTSVWSGSAAHTVVRGGLPPALTARAARAALAARAAGGGAAPPPRSPELAIDLPAAWARSSRPALPLAPLVEASVLRSPQTPAPSPLPLSAAAIAGLAIAADTGVIALLREASGSVLVRYELDGRPQWRAPHGCRGEQVLSLVASSQLVLCLGSGEAGQGVLIATDLASGALRWERTLLADEQQVAGDVALLRGADHATLLRLSDGAELASWRSDDGGRVPAALLEAGGAVLLVGREGGAVVARWPLAAMIPLWSVNVDGEVEDVLSAGAGAVVALSSGEAYGLRGVDGAVSAVGGEAERWLSSGEGILGVTREALLGHPELTRVALYAQDGALRWAYDLALPGAFDVRAGAARGSSALFYGEALDHALPFDERGLGEPIALPESAATAIWVRPLTSALGVARWAGISSTSARWWTF